MARRISETPFQLGFRAGRARQKRGICPYPAQTNARKNWLKWYAIGLRVRHGCNVMNDSPDCKRPTDCVASARCKLCRSCVGTVRMKHLHSDPVLAEAARQRGSDHLKRMWDDPVFRAERTAANKARAAKVFTTKASRARSKATIMALLADPDFVAKSQAGLRAYFAQPEVRAAKIKQIAKVNATPGMAKKRHRAMVRAGHWISDKDRIAIMEAVRDTKETQASIGKRFNRTTRQIGNVANSFGVFRGKKLGPRRKS